MCGGNMYGVERVETGIVRRQCVFFIVCWHAAQEKHRV